MIENINISQSEFNKYRFDKAELLNILDRTINFIRSCDNKSSAILGFIGIILAIFFSNDGIENLFNAIRLFTSSELYIVYICLLCISFILFIFGIIFLVFVLLARTDNSKYKQIGLKEDSVLFFETVVNRNYLLYKKKLLSINNIDYEDDIISQIYINSKICQTKYRDYRIGFIFVIIGLISFIYILSLGIFLYNLFY